MPWRPEDDPARGDHDRALALDRLLPIWGHGDSVSRVVRVPLADVFDAITDLDLLRLPVARVLL